jgi:DNA-binding transcriptional LysR family regulator
MDERVVVLAVVDAQGFSAPAKRLGSTPAAVSRRVKALEQRLGVRLLQRTTRKPRLTDAGERYFREVSRLLGELGAVEQSLAEEAGQPTGELRIVAPMSFGQRRLAPVVARFAAEHRKLRVTLMLEDRQTDLVGEGIDVAMRISYPHNTCKNAVHPGCRGTCWRMTACTTTSSRNARSGPSAAKAVTRRC